jgi:hypothetical protein
MSDPKDGTNGGQSGSTVPPPAVTPEALEHAVQQLTEQQATMQKDIQIIRDRAGHNSKLLNDVLEQLSILLSVVRRQARS